MKRFSSSTLIAALSSVMLLAAGCKNEGPKAGGGDSPAAKKGADDHGHPSEGPHGGHLIELGAEEYHAELAHDGAAKKVTVYLLDSEAKKSALTAVTEVTINLVVDGKPAQFTLPAVPQENDPAGQSSRFELADKALCDGWDAPKVTGRLNVTIGDKSFTGTIEHTEHGEHETKGHKSTEVGPSPGQMPQKVANDDEQNLYLTPGGKYTEDDIRANGSVTASEKFKGFKAAHDLHPKAGENVCPITLTKANPKCTWIVNGKAYEFCCPPCVDEFVKAAKEDPANLKEPDDYVKE